MITVDQVKGYLQEVQTELKKVVYPTREDVQASTAVVLVTVFIIAVFLGVVDRILSKLVALVLG